MIPTPLLALLIAAATPAAAPSPGVAPAVDPHAGHAMEMEPPGDPACAPEHAAMGHCTPSAPPPAPPPSPPPSPPAAADPDCPPAHAAMGHCTPRMAPVPQAGPSAAARSGPEYAADAIWGAAAMARARRAVYAEHGGLRGSKTMLDRLEYRAHKGGDGYAWEGEAWYGGDYDRLWMKTEGEAGFGRSPDSAEVQLLWSHAIDPWFNLQGGIRYDLRPSPDRAHLALGLQGLVPYFFELDVAAFLSDRGDLTARIEADYDQRITNRLILQPRLEMNLAAQDVHAIGIGRGLSSIQSGLRLRYEFVPEFAPYLGVDYERRLGDTADRARAMGRDVGGWAFVTGLRAWF